MRFGGEILQHVRTRDIIIRKRLHPDDGGLPENNPQNYIDPGIGEGYWFPGHNPAVRDEEDVQDDSDSEQSDGGDVEGNSEESEEE